MWLFLTKRLRTWLIVTLLLPVATGVLRRLGETLERRRGSTALSRSLLRAGAVGDHFRARLRGR
jgi:hypothetical protein